MQVKTMHRMACSAAVLLAFVNTPSRAEEPVPCEKVESIGVAAMDSNRVISMRIRTLPPGPDGEGTFTYKPGDKDYQMVLEHLGGLVPGQHKFVKPWC